MASIGRYFVAAPIVPGRMTLRGGEAHHLVHVMRAIVGTEITLFDGSGGEYSAVIESVGRDEAEVMVGQRREINRELPAELVLGVALPKGDRQRWLVEKATELGVSRIVPLRTQRSVAQPVDSVLMRLRRVVIEASKQCGRNRLMWIDQPQTWPAFIEAAAGSACRLLAQPAGFHRGPHFPLPENPSGRVVLAVGPEGGFTGQEVNAAVLAGWHTVDLGPRILRVETAALALAAMVADRWSR